MMRFRIRKSAHVLERTGLAMAGAAGGLFVGAQVGASIPMFTSQGFIFIMMIGGAIGFYLGIDTPPLPFHGSDGKGPGSGSDEKVDAAEFLTAVGTFFAALTAFVSVALIVFSKEPHLAWTILIMLGWVVGVLMQIIAGAMARVRRQEGRSKVSART